MAYCIYSANIPVNTLYDELLTQAEIQENINKVNAANEELLRTTK